MHLGMKPQKSSCIVGFGNYCEDIAHRAAELYFAGYAPKILFSGGLGRNTEGRWSTSEAEHFAAIAAADGVPEAHLLVERKSRNTRENILFTKALMEENAIPAERILAVHQPCMERRIYAALKVYWPELDAVVTSPQLSIREYIDHAGLQGLDEHTVIDVITGDFQRIGVYAEKGWQIPQRVPDVVYGAFERLVKAGYDRQLVST